MICDHKPGRRGYAWRANQRTEPMEQTRRQLFATRVSYEWVVEQLDQWGDIEENHFVESYAEAVELASTFDDANVALWRNTGSHVDGITERDFAYVENGKLGNFDTGSPTPPKRYREEVSRF